MSAYTMQRLRSGAIVAATVLLGITWSFALFHIKTPVYPLLWAVAMPLLAFYYFSGSARLTGWKHLPGAALSIYAVVLWQVSRHYGVAGVLATAIGVLASLAAVWLGGRARRDQAPATSPSATPGSVLAPRDRTASVSLGSGVARRRRLRAGSARR